MSNLGVRDKLESWDFLLSFTGAAVFVRPGRQCRGKEKLWCAEKRLSCT